MKRAQLTEERVFPTALDRLTGGERPEAVPPPEPPRGNMIKLSVFVNREEDAYLEGLSSAAKFGGGKKLSKTRLVEAMIRAFRTSRLDVSGVSDDEELLRRVTEQLR